MSVDPRTRARILKALDRVKVARKREDERHDAVTERLRDQAADLIEEGARAGMSRQEFVDNPYSNRILSEIFRERGLVQRPRKPADSSTRRPSSTTKKG